MRRWREVQDYRVEERARQRACRERRRKGACHAPPSAPKSSEFKDKLLESWDKAAAMSRATFERRLPVILRRLGYPDGTAGPPSGAPSRATFAPEVSGNAGS